MVYLWHDISRSATPTFVEPRVACMKETLKAISPKSFFITL